MDQVIFANHFLTMTGAGVGYHGTGALAIDHGKIQGLYSREEGEKIKAKKKLYLNHHVILPGFIDGHIHSSLAILRGIAQDTDSWMMGALAPFENILTRDERLLGSKLAYIEGIKNGTTTFGDYEVFGEDICQWIEKIGVRGNITQFVRSAKRKAYKPGELYEFDEEMGEKSLEENCKLYDKYHNPYGRIRVLIGPQGADFVHKDLLLRCRKEAIKRKTKIHLHLQQGDRETEQIEKRYGMRPVEYLDSLGYLDENLLGVHLTDCTEEEARLVAKRGVSMLFCPGSIGIIDGIVPPVLPFLEEGGKVALGSDQASGNNCHNIFNEMKLTSLFSKIKTKDPKTMPAWKSLRLATIDGAKAIGLEDIGSIETGKWADLIAIDLHSPTMQPVYTDPLRNFVPNIVYAGGKIAMTMVAGEIIFDGEKIHTIDEDEVYQNIKDVVPKISERGKPGFKETGGINKIFMENGKL
ncbi:MAG: amidohydrolase family protein [Tissierellia bacterium]|nr:amidohydrolase family protein [Tissierellia bacterium]